MSRIEIRQMKGIPSEIPFTADPKTGFEVTEYGERSLRIQTKTRIAEGQLVSLEGNIWDREGIVYEFIATGKVVGRADSEDGFLRIEIHLHQFDRELWGNFLKDQSSAQERVERLLKAMKGEEE